MSLLSQIVVGICFLILIIVLFFDDDDYLSYAVLLMVLAGLISGLDPELSDARNLDNYIKAIDWEVIFFLIAMFTIAEILNDTLIFHAIAKIIVKKFSHNPRTMFYVLCIVSTLSATIIEDLSVAIIFIPIIVLSCHEMEINPYPYLMGMTICINLASTLTPFGSAENIMIASTFDLSLMFFISNLSIYFIVSTTITLILLDKLVLSKHLGHKFDGVNEIPIEELNEDDQIEPDPQKNSLSSKEENDTNSTLFDEIVFKPSLLRKNFLGFVAFICLLLIIEEIFIAGLIGMILFVFINGYNEKSKKLKPDLSHYLGRLNYKLIYFFMCLYILVYLMIINGTVDFFEDLILKMNISNLFVLSVIILLITSILSGFMDNAPVTVVFLPIIEYLSSNLGYLQIPILVGFILGINLGGNFLPQGSAADMMTLELGKEYCVFELSYRKLTKVGGLFALIHIILGIIYLAIITPIF